MSRAKKYLLLLATLFVLMFGSALAVNAASQTMTATQTKANQTTINVSWNYVSGADHYRLLYYMKGKTQSDAQGINYIYGTSYQITGLTLAKTYYVNVEAYDRYGTLINEDPKFRAMHTIPGKINSYKLVDCDNDGTGLTFRSSIVPYSTSTTYAGVEGVQWKLTNLSGTTIKTGTTTTTGFKANVSTNRCYNLYVRGYITINGARRYGVWSNKKLIVPQPKLYNLALASNNRINVKWRKVSGATSYIIYGSTSSGSGYRKIATVSSSKSNYIVSKVLGKSLVKYKNYYFKVRAVRSGTNSPVTNYAYGYIYTVVQ